MLGAGAVTGSWNHPILGCEIDAKAQTLASALRVNPGPCVPFWQPVALQASPGLFGWT